MRWLGIAAGVLLIGVAVGLFFLYSQTDVEAALKRGEWVSVLVIGLDNGAQGAVQADFIGVASLSPTGEAAWLNVPRELGLPSGNDWHPLYAAYRDDPARFAYQLSSLLEISIPYWVTVDFDGFREFVDSVGGVDVVVESRLRYSDHSQGLEIDIPAGQQHLNGELALQYLRYRAESKSEPSRALRTKKFLLALWGKLHSLPWSRWKQLARLAHDHVSTNLSIWELLALLTKARAVGREKIAFASCPVADSDKPDLVGIRKLTDEIYRGRDYYLRSEVKVAVLNGTGERFLASRARVWLLKRGFAVVRIGNADRSDYQRSLIVYREGEGSKAQMLAQVLPVQAELMKAATFGADRFGGWPQGADVVLILGKGFDVKL